MAIEIILPARLQPLGDTLSGAIEPRCGTLAALLLLMGNSPLRRRALPSHRSPLDRVQLPDLG